MNLPSPFYLWALTAPLPGETIEGRCEEMQQAAGWNPLERDPRTGRQLLHAVIENHAHRRFLDAREGDRQLALLTQTLLGQGCDPGEVFDGQTALDLAITRQLWTTARVLEPVSPPAAQTVDQAQLLSELKAGFLEDFIEIEGTREFRRRMESTSSEHSNGATLLDFHAAAFMGSAQEDGYYSGDHLASEKLMAWVSNHKDKPELAGFWALSSLCLLARGCVAGEDNVLTFARTYLSSALADAPQAPELLLAVSQRNPLDGLIDRQRWGATLLGACAAINIKPSLLVEKDGWEPRHVGELAASLLENGWAALFGGPVQWEAEDWPGFSSSGRVQWKSSKRNVHPMIAQHLHATGNLWATLGPLNPLFDGLCSADQLTQARWPIEQHPWLLRLTKGEETQALIARQCHLEATLAPSIERRASRL